MKLGSEPRNQVGTFDEETGGKNILKYTLKGIQVWKISILFFALLQIIFRIAEIFRMPNHAAVIH